MSERPILFSGPMVRAILEGRKTMTRRVVKLPLKDRDFGCELSGNEIGQFEWNRLSPYGGPGDRLWVRESGWERPERSGLDMREGADTWEKFYYDADVNGDDDTLKAWGFKRRPSIHMPRWASRITLEVTGVRVGRLQEISEEDAQAEGVERPTPTSWHPDAGEYTWRDQFSLLWDSINAKRAPWESNPFVWVIEFKRIAEER